MTRGDNECECELPNILGPIIDSRSSARSRRRRRRRCADCGGKFSTYEISVKELEAGVNLRASVTLKRGVFRFSVDRLDATPDSNE